MKRVLSFVLLTACVSPPDPAALGMTDNVADWRDEIIYQVMTDRFSNGDLSNDVDTNVLDPSAYHGGDWRGITDKLDYLETLGVTALWISPVVRNVESDAGFASYHGYWAQDLTRPNLHFGDLSALREMVDAAHARGIKVVLDVVTNHVGQAFFYDINQNGQPDEFDIGQGGAIEPIGQDGSTSQLVRVSEWDPDFDRAGVQAWTSLGPSGPAPVVFLDDPSINRVPPYPEVLAQPWAYNQRGRVTVWDTPEVCDCPAWGCAWNDECRREQEVLGDFPGGLKDLATTQQPVRDALFESYAHWIEVADFDGFRIDTLKHVEPEFFLDFCPRIRDFARERGKKNFFLFGEAFDGDDNLLGSYTQGEGVDGVFYFSQYYTVMRGVLTGDGARTCEIERLHCRRYGCAADPCGEEGPIEALYSDTPKRHGLTAEDGRPLVPQELPVGFIENHDVGRLLYFLQQAPANERRARLHLALTYLMTMDGVPSLYYGVEQELAGGNDPANRETLWDERAYREWVAEDGGYAEKLRQYDGHDWRPFDTGNPTFTKLQRLIALRKQLAPLRRGELQFRWSTTDDGGLLVYERRLEGEVVVVALNFGTSEASATPAVSLEDGAELRDVLGSGSFETASSGCTHAAGESCLGITVPGLGARIFVVED